MTINPWFENSGVETFFLISSYIYVDINNECPHPVEGEDRERFFDMYPKKRSFRPTPYAFRHYFSLSDDINKFQTIIKGIEPNESMPANIDSPESGLDAMAQAMLCKGIHNY